MFANKQTNKQTAHVNSARQISNFSAEVCQVFEQSKSHKPIKQSVTDTNTTNIDKSYILRSRYDFLLPFKEDEDQNVTSAHALDGTR